MTTDNYQKSIDIKKYPLKDIYLITGGDDRARTDYLLTASQTLSQVSYAPS